MEYSGDDLQRNYENLANAIIFQAVKDWRKSVRKIRKSPFEMQNYHKRDECEEFFLSPLFACLTELDGELLLKNLKEKEVNGRKWRWNLLPQ